VEIKLTNSQLKTVQEYCKLNNIEDVNKFISKCFTSGFNTTKYGLLGDDSGKTDIVGEKQVEIEVIREIRVEVPIEVIKYVDREVIVEVPVPIIEEKRDEPEPIIIEKIVEVIKEVPVDRIIEVEKVVEVIKEVIVEVEKSNDKSKLLQETLQKLRKELSLKNARIETLENINKELESIKISQGAVYLKGSNINETM
jgi:hypothetical protein